MLDIERIRKEPEWLDTGLKNRGVEPLSAKILDLDQQRRALQTKMQTGQAESNKFAKDIGALMAKGDKEAAEKAKAEVAALKKSIAEAETAEAAIAEQLNTILVSYPNIPANDVVIGKDETANKEISRFMEPTKFSFKPKDHVELGEGLGLLDFPAAVKMSGSRFFVTKGALSRLERAMNLYALDMLTTEFGYTEVSAPFLVNDAAMFGTGNLPKFGEDAFRTNTDHWLVPTSEVSMTNLVMDQIIDPKQFPIRYTAYTPCFRSEAGSAGKDTRGLIRVHQFSKVEQVVITTPDQSQAEHERMTNAAEEMLRRLKLPYRKIMLCTGDMGFASTKTYDIETWVPTQETYRETMSCSNCGDFQARRMKARYKPEGSTKTEFVHTLNATCIATPRALVAVMENYQQEDGSIKVPDVLVPYMNGLTVIRK
jgi:seryl-tRNA synthetase